MVWTREALGKIPVLGICRGLQLVNVVLGGTLHDDLPSDPIKHTSNKKEVAGEPKPLMESSFHDIYFEDGTVLRVNSRHHQGIKDLAEGLRVLASCKEDSLPEMVEGENLLMVQWHPEREDVWGTRAEEIVYEWIKKHDGN
jgi:putative glutamine amidotransferase